MLNKLSRQNPLASLAHDCIIVILHVGKHRDEMQQWNGRFFFRQRDTRVTSDQNDRLEIKLLEIQQMECYELPQTFRGGATAMHRYN